jgi:para-nitrobenzyl esterase
MPTEVETSGGRLKGREEGGVRIFRGVRYARPLEGQHRFLPPKPVVAQAGLIDATEVGPAAPQYALPFFGWISAAGVAHGDDCLSLNVWTPGLDAAKRPVVVWIHGGGFMVGAGSTPIYDGADLAQRGDLVVVTLNYRLGAPGFVHLKYVLGPGFEQTSNLGVRDQIAALEWIRENIAGFGGDPDNVTVFGQSAGAMSIGALLGAPDARRLFRRAICQSGAADHVIDQETATNVASTFIDELGQKPSSPRALGEIPVKEILRAQRGTMTRCVDMRTMMIFLPAADGEVIPEQPLEAVRRGDTADLRLMIGTTLEEWRLFRLIDPGPLGLSEEALVGRFEEALPARYPDAPDARTAIREFRAALAERGADTGAANVWTAFQSARMMHFPASQLAEAHADAGGSAHAYLFSWHPPALRRALGSCHALDIPFIFGSIRHPLALPLTGFTASAARLSRKMQAAWIRFARGGDPSHARLPGWPSYERGDRATMELGRNCALGLSPLEAERRLFERWSGGPPPSNEQQVRRRGAAGGD